MKKKVITASVLSIILCVCLIVGATVAIFTSSRDANIAVTSGRVDLKAALSDITTYSAGEEQDANSFANGGTAAMSDNSVTLGRITPGDKAVIAIQLTNNSDVSYKYRYSLRAEGDEGLTGQLLIGTSEDGAEYSYYTSLVTAWKDGIEESATLYLSIELPVWANNGAQAGGCEIFITIEAVQANAADESGAAVSAAYIAENQEEIESALAAMQSGDTLVLGGAAAWKEATIAYDDDREIKISGWDVENLTVNVPNGQITYYINYGELSDQWDGTTKDTSWYSDDKREFTLSTAEQFAGLTALVNNGKDFEGKSIYLANGIDLNGQEWDIIGNGSRDGSSVLGASFKGTFDGNGHTISGLKITKLSPIVGDLKSAADNALGLFGLVDGGSVGNFTLDKVDINVSESECAGGAVGMLAGNGTVHDVTVNGSVKAARGNGGVVGRMIARGTIRDCTNNAEIIALSSSGNTGGIVGAAYYTSKEGTMLIENCVNTGAISGYSGVGGIVGLSAANVTGCKNSGAVEGNGFSVGGIVGEQQNYGDITDNTNTADITNASTAKSNYGTGGIVGWVRYSGADSAYPLKAMVTVSGNYNGGSILADQTASAGGIVGHFYNYGVVKNNVNTAAKISAVTFAAGIVGSMQEELEHNAFKEETYTIMVEHNISTTPYENITADGKDLFAYSNNADRFFSVNNGTTLR